MIINFTLINTDEILLQHKGSLLLHLNKDDRVIIKSKLYLINNKTYDITNEIVTIYVFEQ